MNQQRFLFNSATLLNISNTSKYIVKKVIEIFDKPCYMVENSRMKKQHIQLTETDRAYLEGLISKGNLKAKVYRRALGLLELDRGKTYTAVAETIQVTIPTLSGWASDYQEN
jgi:hypothetical protein